MQEKSMTIYDIAKEAGVSPATVSRVLTGNARVKEDKKEKILNIIKENDFKPNALARSLINKATKTIGFIVPDITNPFFSGVFLEAEKKALSLGYTMILCNSMNDNKMNRTGVESLYLDMLREKQVDGIVIMGGRANEKKSGRGQAEELKAIRQKIPVVFINGAMSGVKSYHVAADEKSGMQELIKYLAALGHKRVGFIGGRKGITSTDIKHTAFLEAVKQGIFQSKEEWLITSNFSVEDGYESMKKLLDCKELPTAVMAVNDFTAIGAINAAKDRGLRVPEDISVTGFDGIYMTEAVRPRITTVSQNYMELGAKAIEIIDKLTLGEKVKRKYTVDTMVLIKDSCSSPL